MIGAFKNTFLKLLTTNRVVKEVLRSRMNKFLSHKYNFLSSISKPKLSNIFWSCFCQYTPVFMEAAHY